MTPLFKKLNYKAPAVVHVMNAPADFSRELMEMKKFAMVSVNENDLTELDFVMVFVTTVDEINQYINKVFSKLKGDAVLWFCYPKGSSKKYTCEFNRDKGWEGLEPFNLVAVRSVAIDENWTGLRFRKLEHIKVMTRKGMNTMPGRKA
jgi:hypothetical protein